MADNNQVCFFVACNIVTSEMCKCSMSDALILIRAGLSLALIVNGLLFLLVPAGTSVSVCVFVCALAPVGRDGHCCCSPDVHLSYMSN